MTFFYFIICILLTLLFLASLPILVPLLLIGGFVYAVYEGLK